MLVWVQLASAQVLHLPPVSDTPQAIAEDEDPFLAALASRPVSGFPQRLAVVAEALPAVSEGQAEVEAARAVRDQWRSRLFPAAGLDLIAAASIARDFDRPTTVFESLVPRRRSDVVGSINQLITDFGATSARIRAQALATSSARAELDRDRVDGLVALAGAWYEGLGARTALALARDHRERLAELAQAAEARFAGGRESGGDVARARSALAAADARVAEAVRRQSAAHARLVELFGEVPSDLGRADVPKPMGGAGERPEIRVASAQAEQAAALRSAAKADRLPRLDARVTGSAFDIAGRGAADYDVRAQLTLSTRFSTGGAEAARQSELAARARAARYAVDRVAAMVEREQEVATAEVQALTDTTHNLRIAYLDSRRARDLFAERFRVSRGTVFDMLVAERELFENASALAEAEYRLDVSRWLLLARNGQLLPAVTGAAP